MKRIECRFTGVLISFEQAKNVARLLAEQENDLALLISCGDRDKGVHSPQCLQCEIKGEPGWEVYGRKHEGR